MACVLTVKGTIQHGRLKEFGDRVGRFVEYRKQKRWAVPEVLYGLSGPMNTVMMLFRYEDLGEFESEMKAERSDGEYGEIASQMPYAVGSICYELYQEGA